MSSFAKLHDLVDMTFRHERPLGIAATSTERSIATLGEDLTDDAFYYAGTYRVTVSTPASTSMPAATVNVTGTVHCGFD